MVTTAEKTSKKRKPKFDVLNVDRYLAFAPCCGEGNVCWNLVKYLNSHRNAEFTSLDDIGETLRKEYKLEDTEYRRGTISRAVTDIDCDLKFKDGIYYFAKEDGLYKLRPRYPAKEPKLIELFKMEKAFWKNTVHQIGSNTLVFTVNPSQTIKVKEGFSALLGSSACYGIMVCDEHLVIMLNERHEEYEMIKKMLLDFFDRLERYKRRLLKEKERENAIREERKKHKNFDLAGNNIFTFK